jgi:hypothetical protein
MVCAQPMGGFATDVTHLIVCDLSPASWSCHSISGNARQIDQTN